MLALLSTIAMLIGCASVGTPDGGPYDETPPVFVGSNPKMDATNVKNKTINLEFNELIQIENASEKVIISPPQREQPEIRVNGKRIQVILFDSLQKNSTYTIDFSDGIVDNNEANPLGDFCFRFSTGENLDTMQVSGYVLSAEDLEPVKGIQVGLYSELSDSIFTKQPFQRVSRTDGSGRFTIRGVKPGSYKIYALNDMDQSFSYTQRSEAIAWYDSIVVPSSELRVRDDTLRHPDGSIDTIVTVEYRHFLPDDIVLRLSTAKPIVQYLTKSGRSSHEKMELIFAIPMDSMPFVRGLNFDESSSYIVEHSANYDTLTFWMKDSTCYYNDTLHFTIQYPSTDTLGVSITQIDTLHLSPRRSRARILQDEAKRAEEEAKRIDKERKRLERNNDTLGLIKLNQPTIKYLSIESNGSNITLNDIYTLKFKEPIVEFNDSSLHISRLDDSVWVAIPFEREQHPIRIREYNIYAEWRPNERYKIEIDSAKVIGLYGQHNNTFSQEIQFGALELYSTFTVYIDNAKSSYIVELLNSKGDLYRRQRLEESRNNVTFYFLQPGKYYVRLLDDANHNGRWDPGEYAEGRAPENIYYLNKEFTLKQNWYHETEVWDPLSTPLYQQKPLTITKQKADTKRKIQNRNAEREAKMAASQKKR